MGALSSFSCSLRLFPLSLAPPRFPGFLDPRPAPAPGRPPGRPPPKRPAPPNRCPPTNPEGDLAPPARGPILVPLGRFVNLGAEPVLWDPIIVLYLTPAESCGDRFWGAPSVRPGRLFKLRTLFGRPVPRRAGGRTTSARLGKFENRSKGREEGSDDRLMAPRAEAAVTERSRRFGGGLRSPSSSARRRGPVEKGRGRSLEVSFASALRPRTRRVA